MEHIVELIEKSYRKRVDIKTCNTGKVLHIGDNIYEIVAYIK